MNVMPKPRYTVRAGDNRRYSVWDNERDRIATSPSGDREYRDLSFDEAFNAADQLALGEQAPQPPTGQPTQHAAQQQAQPQPDQDKKK
jgi:hypothetical protein